MLRLRYIVATLLFLFVACAKEEPTAPTSATLRSIECPNRSYTLDALGTTEIPFRVEDSKALFNYAISTIGFQVQLRLEDEVTQSPTEFELVRVVADDEEQGLYRATIADNGSSAMYSQRVHIAIKRQSGELVLSNAVRIASSNYVSGINSIAIEKRSNPSLTKDILFAYDPKAQSYTAHIDEYIADRRFKVRFETDGIDNLKVEGVAVENNETVIDFKHDATLTADIAGTTYEYSLHLGCFTGLPVLRIETPGGQGVWSKDVWVEGSTLWLDGMGRFDNIEGVEMAIRGRGNSTWGYEKKPYAIKFTEKQKVMGMPKHKRWVLLANYMDRTLIRNRVAFFLAEQTSLAWTPRTEFVELFLNGQHLGQYLLSEQVRVDNDRIAITEMTPSDNSGDAITGGYLLELDFHFDNQWQWWSDHGTPFAVKFPDEEDLTSEQLNWIKSHIAEAESAIYGSNFTNTTSGYTKYIDAQSFIDYWLIYELCVNHELGNPGSVYLTKDRGGKLVAGPVWDFDWGTFSYNASPHAKGKLFITWAWWYNRLFEDPAFWDLARERWAVLKPKFMTVFDFIEQEREYIERSWSKNFSMWGISTDINGDERLSFDDAIDRLTEITRERIEAVDKALKY
ncbi:MAG: CotH kinase family protein [Alistipes sp.]|nr:CotH kinase family protein [Alistipes sp.]